MLFGTDYSARSIPTPRFLQSDLENNITDHDYPVPTCEHFGSQIPIPAFDERKDIENQYRNEELVDHSSFKSKSEGIVSDCTAYI